ncbi:MAG: hypothetical protein QNJ97_00770 [Myxococcota bacterium]|nr:hypothetical protein [Myxococcota bacterium]
MDDTTLERCYRVIGLGSFIQTVDCVPYYSDSDQMCVEDDASNIGCTSGECPTDDPYADWCEKDVLMNCFQGLLRKRDCKERGLKCREATDQNGFLYAFCGTGEECPNEAPFCQGNRLTNCDANTHTEVVSYIDCDKKISGFICSEMDSWGWCGMPEEVDECEPGLINCDGDVAEICYFGKLITVDCSTFEDATCYKTPDDYPNSDLIMCISK